MARILFLFALASLTINGQTERTIAVDGEAEVLVRPDHVVVALGVETQGKTPDDALRSNGQIIGRLVELARSSRVGEPDLQIDFVQFQVQHAHQTSIPIEFYTARKSLVVTLRDLGQFESFLTSALKAGATHLQGVDFRTSELRKHRDTAREMAIKAAREKAAALAGAVGRRIGARPVHIASSNVDSRSWYGSGWSGAGSIRPMLQNVSMAAESPAATPPLAEGVAFGRISVTARVSATFAIE
jgi:uncharacterized protein YggE